jgi:hypothetical protein
MRLRSWRSAAVAATALASLCSAADMPKGIFHGTMAGFDGTTKSGVLMARNKEGDVFNCGYDSLSYFQYQHEKIPVTKLETGDPLEILTDHKPGTTVCYVRFLEVVPPQPRRSPRRQEPPTRAVYQPKGDRTVAGVVIRLDRTSVTLRTRDGEETLLLRPDTRYFGDGLTLEATDLKVNTRVSVRAGPDLFGRIQAYQVAWGEMLDVP